MDLQEISPVSNKYISIPVFIKYSRLFSIKTGIILSFLIQCQWFYHENWIGLSDKVFEKIAISRKVFNSRIKKLLQYDFIKERKVGKHKEYSVDLIKLNDFIKKNNAK